MIEEAVPTSFSDLIADGVLEIGDGYRAKLAELGGDGPIFLRAGRLTDDGLDLDGAERFRCEVLHRVGQKLGQPGDTIITTKGNSVGRSGFVPDDCPPFAYSPHLSFWRSRNPQRLVPAFLRYWANGPEFRSQLKAMAHGTDMAPYLSLADQRRLRITLPAVAHQAAVAEVLGALDGKIESNARICSLSYQLLRAHLERAIEGSPAGTTRLSQVVEINALRAKPSDGECRYVDISSVSADSRPLGELMPWSKAPGRARRGVRSGDVIWSTVRPERRSHALVLTPSADMVVSTGFAVLSPRHIGSATLYGLVSRPEFVDFLVSVSEGSAYPAVRSVRFGEALIPLPDPSCAAALEADLRAFADRADASAAESAALAALRDALLPALLSGRLRVHEAMELVGEGV